MVVQVIWEGVKGKGRATQFLYWEIRGVTLEPPAWSQDIMCGTGSSTNMELLTTLYKSMTRVFPHKVLTRNAILKCLTRCRGSYSSLHIHRPITFHLVPWTRRQQVQSKRPHVTTNIHVTHIKTQRAVNSFPEVTAKQVISTDFHLVSLGNSRQRGG